MARYLDLTAFLFVGWGVFQLVIALAMGGLYALMGLGAMVAGSAEGEASVVVMGAVFLFLGLFLGLFVAASAVPAFAAAVGIRRRVPWGRIVGFIAAALGMMNFPIGTAVGVFALVVLLDKEAGAEFSEANRLVNAP